MYKKIIRFILYANHHANQRKVRKTMPTNVPTTFNKWQNSAEKSQAHNLNVEVSPPLQRIYSIKLITYIALKEFNFLVFLRFKPDNDYRLINNVFIVIQTHK